MKYRIRKDRRPGSSGQWLVTVPDRYGYGAPEHTYPFVRYTAALLFVRTLLPHDAERRQEDAQQKGNDGNHNQKLYEGKPSLLIHYEPSYLIFSESFSGNFGKAA